MSSAQATAPASDFAGRLAHAIEAEKKNPTRTGREAGLQDGYIFKLLGVAKAKQVFSPGPEVIRQLADYLHVSYEWLAIGRGPMRPAGWAPTPFGEAKLFALAHRVREDAIDAAGLRYEPNDLTAADWVVVFEIEARRLERSGAPTPGASRTRRALERKLAELDAIERAATAERTAARRGGAA